MNDITTLLTLFIVIAATYIVWPKRASLIEDDLAKRSIIIISSCLIALSFINILTGSSLTKLLKSLPENISDIEINPIAGTSIKLRFGINSTQTEFSNFTVFPQVLINKNYISIKNGETVSIRASGLVSTHPSCNWYTLLSNKKLAQSLSSIIDEKCLYLYDGKCASPTSNEELSQLASHIKIKEFNEEHMPLWRTPDGESPYALPIPTSTANETFEQIMHKSKAIPNSEWGMLIGHATFSNDYISSIETIAKSSISSPNNLIASFPIGSSSDISLSDKTITIVNKITGRTFSYETNKSEIYLWLGVNDITFTDKLIDELNATILNNPKTIPADTTAVLKILTFLKSQNNNKSALFRTQFGYIDNVGLFTVSSYKSRL